MKRLAVSAIALLCAATFAVSQDLPKIAVYVTGLRPDGVEKLRLNEKKVFGTLMQSKLHKTGRYVLIERFDDFIEAVDKEHVKQRDGETDDSQISQLGKRFGVKFICVADITPAYGKFQISVRIINVETLEVPYIAQQFFEKPVASNLPSAMDTVVVTMFGNPTMTPSESKPETVAAQVVDRGKEAAVQPPTSTGASIFLATLPAKAEVYIGGKLVGRSNEGKLQVPVGIHEVRFVKDNLEDTVTMTFHPGENPTKFITLNKIGKKQRSEAALKDFTVGQRWGTWGLNYVIAGLGSLTIMKDYTGAAIHASSAVISFGMLYAGINNRSDGLVYTGLLINLSGGIYSIVRCTTYRKPGSQIANHPLDGLDVAVLPDQDGNIKGHVAYSMEF